MQLMKLLCSKHKSICQIPYHQFAIVSVFKTQVETQFTIQQFIQFSSCQLFTKTHIHRQLQIDLTQWLFKINQDHYFINLTYIFSQPKPIKWTLVDSFTDLINNMSYHLV